MKRSNNIRLPVAVLLQFYDKFEIIALNYLGENEKLDFPLYFSTLWLWGYYVQKSISNYDYFSIEWYT